MEWNKMDSIVIMDQKCILFVTIITKLKGHIWREKYEQIWPWMNIAIEKQNLSNNEWKVLRMHMQLVLLTLRRKEMCLESKI
jgi:hypothetical protein